MITFENYNIDNEVENLFLELAHLDELEIGFDFINNKYQLLYKYNNVYLFSHDKPTKYLRIKYGEIWSSIEDIFNLTIEETTYHMNKMTEKYFNLYDYITINVNYINFE